MKQFTWLGVHEAGHAVARLVLNEQTGQCAELQTVTVISGDGFMGKVFMPARVKRYIPLATYPAESRDTLIADTRLDILDTMGGPVAELRYRNGSLNAWAGGGDTFSGRNKFVDDAMSASESEFMTNASDSYSARRHIEWIGPADTRAALTELWLRANVIVHVEFPGIVAMARALVAVGTMTGIEFEQRWWACRPNEAARRRRMKQITS